MSGLSKRKPAHVLVDKANYRSSSDRTRVHQAELLDPTAEVLCRRRKSAWQL